MTYHTKIDLAFSIFALVHIPVRRGQMRCWGRRLGG